MTEDTEKLSVFLVDPLAGNRGHLIDDDLFLSECIAPLTEEFLLASSPASVANVRQYLKVATHELKPVGTARLTRFRLLRIVSALPCASFKHVIFQSFEEVSTLIFMILHPRKHIHLIVTNNLRPDRLKRHPTLGGFFLRQVFLRASTIIVHCQHEARKVLELAPDIHPEKIFVKPFHKITQQQTPLSLPQKKPTVLYLGPEFPHKTVAPVIELIRQDTECRYHYVLCALSNNMSAKTREFFQFRTNVDLVYGYSSDGEYYRRFREASLVILTHDQDYEGVLSGAFCDAIASGTPVIARKMAPLDEFFGRFGPMGFFVDFSDSSWPARVLGANLEVEYEKFQQNMVLFRESCSVEPIRNVFRSVLAQKSLLKSPAA